MLAWRALYFASVDTNELMIRMFTELREEMNARFERVETKLDQKADAKSLEAVQASLLAEIGKLNDRLTDEVLWGRREMRSRLERCERDIEELKNRKGS